jgi:hypothetical protein
MTNLPTSLFSMIPTVLVLLLALGFTYEADARTGRHARRASLAGPTSTTNVEDSLLSRSLHRSPDRRATSGWEYVGCVTDGGSRALTDYSGTDSSNTPDNCIATCASKGFIYAGVECE